MFAHFVITALARRAQRRAMTRLIDNDPELAQVRAIFAAAGLDRPWSHYGPDARGNTYPTGGVEKGGGRRGGRLARARLADASA